MGLFSRNKKVVNEATTKKEIKSKDELGDLIIEQKLNKIEDTIGDLTTSTKSAVFNGIDIQTADEEKLFEIYRQMDADPIISSALDLFADNATQVDPNTGHVVFIKSNNQAFSKEINSFLWDVVKIDTESWNMIRSLAQYGKVILDTKASNNGKEWSFLEVDHPEYIYPLTYGQDNIKYYAVKQQIEDDKSKYSYGMFASSSLNNGTSQNGFTIEDKFRYISAFNGRKHAGKMQVAIEHPTTNNTTIEELYIRTGKSMLEGVINTWLTLGTLEDSLFLNRLTKSTSFNLVSIDVGDSNNKQTDKLITSVKNAFKSNETLDLKSQRYQNRTSPIQVDDFIYIPKKGEKGTVTVTRVGGDVGTQDLSDINYQRNKLFAGLGVLKAYLGFEETIQGGLGETTLTMLDERFTRKVKRLRTQLSFIIDQIIVYYWLYSSTTNTLDNLPDYEIVLGKLSSQEEEANNKAFLDNIEKAERLIGLTQNFEEQVNREKLFKYIFNNILKLDISSFDNSADINDIKVVANQLLKENKENNKPNKNLINSIKSEPTNIHNRAIRTTSRNLFRESKERIYNKLSAYESNKNNILKSLNEYDIYLLDEEGNETKLDLILDSLINIIDEKTYKDLKTMTQGKDPLRVQKSKKLVAKYKGLSKDNNILFQVTAEDPKKNALEHKPTSYEVEIGLKALTDLIQAQKSKNDLDLVSSAMKGDILVSCECPAAKYWGQQYMGTQQGYSLVKNDIAPTKNIPTQVVCKHTYLALTVLPFWTNTIVKELRNKGVLPKGTKDNTIQNNDLKDKIKSNVPKTKKKGE